MDFSDSAITNAGDIQLDSITGDGDTDTSITFSGSNVITVKAANANQVTFTDGAIVPSSDNDIDLGTNSTEFKDAYFDGTVTTDLLTVSGTTNLDGAIQVDNTITVGVDDTGYDVKFFGDTASAYMLWDTSTDDLVLAGAANLYLYDAGGGEKLSSDGTDLTINSGNDINLTATTDINVPANVGITIGNDGEKIEGDGTDLTIASSGVLNLAAGGTTNQIKVTDGAILPITDDDVDLGSASYQFKNAYFDGNWKQMQ